MKKKLDLRLRWLVEDMYSAKDPLKTKAAQEVAQFYQRNGEEFLRLFLHRKTVPERAEILSELKKYPFSGFALVYDGTHLVGVTQFAKPSALTPFYFSGTIVEKNYQGKGVGTLLVRAIHAYARNRGAKAIKIKPVTLGGVRLVERILSTKRTIRKKNKPPFHEGYTTNQIEPYETVTFSLLPKFQHATKRKHHGK